MEGSSEITLLPEACISHVLSFTTPRDTCRSALVSVTFCSAAGSDTVWSRFLPSDYREILSRAVDPVSFSSLKELYFRLCESVLIDGGRKIFALEKGSGAKCYTMCARDLSIIWGNDEQYWRWVSHPDSRFAEVAELSSVCWLDVSGTIESRDLSPNTMYKAYLIFKLAPNSYGLEFPTQQVSVSLGGYVSEYEVCLHPHKDEDEDGQGLPNPRDRMHDRRVPPGVRVPQVRNDGWMEIKMGEFFNDDGSDGMVSMCFKQVRGHWKHGLIVEGIQFCLTFGS